MLMTLADFIADNIYKAHDQSVLYYSYWPTIEACGGDQG